MSRKKNYETSSYSVLSFCGHIVINIFYILPITGLWEIEKSITATESELIYLVKTNIYFINN